MIYSTDMRRQSSSVLLLIGMASRMFRNMSQLKDSNKLRYPPFCSSSYTQSKYSIVFLNLVTKLLPKLSWSANSSKSSLNPSALLLKVRYSPSALTIALKLLVERIIQFMAMCSPLIRCPVILNSSWDCQAMRIAVFMRLSRAMGSAELVAILRSQRQYFWVLAAVAGSRRSWVKSCWRVKFYYLLRAVMASFIQIITVWASITLYYLCAIRCHLCCRLCCHLSCHLQRIMHNNTVKRRKVSCQVTASIIAKQMIQMGNSLLVASLFTKLFFIFSTLFNFAYKATAGRLSNNFDLTDLFKLINIIMEPAQLEYNQNLPPEHEPYAQTYHGFTLKSLASRKLNSDVLCSKFDREGELLALGLKNGAKILYSRSQNKFIAKTEDLKQNAVTSIKWRPTQQGKAKILATCDAGGYVSFYHVPTLKLLFSLQEYDNSLNSLDFSWTGNHFATAGKDFHVRIYDEDTKSVTHDLKPAGWNSIGHDNRVFALKFIDQNTLISGGWDSVVHIWDVRQGKSVHHFYGPNISGESLDYQNGTIFAGCYSAQNQLQFWDIKTLGKRKTIDWSNNIDDAQYIYTSSYSKRDPTLFGAGSTGPHSEVRVYKESQGVHELVVRLKGLAQGCFSFDFSNRQDQFVFTTPHHGLYVYQYAKAEI